MALPTFTMRQLLEAGVHFGHVTRRWNPKMDPYLFGVRRGVHIIDLQQTVPMLYRAMKSVQDIVAGGGRVLWVGTKRQASEPITKAAKRCGQYYINHRWLGGTMTNWQTISNSIKRLRALDAQMEEENTGFTKKELLRLNRERDKLERALGGIKDMGGLPDVLFIIDTNKESIAVAEANKLGIPVVGVVDSNSNPTGINFPIPGNDDSTRAINLYCELLAGAVLSGIQEEIVGSGGDVGEREEGLVEELPAEEGGTDEAAEPAPEASAEPAPEAPAEPAPEAPAEAMAEPAPEAAAAAVAEPVAEASSPEALAEPAPEVPAEVAAEPAGEAPASEDAAAAEAETAEGGEEAGEQPAAS